VAAKREGQDPHGAAVTLKQPQSRAEWLEARSLIEQYAASLQLDLEFQNFAHELEHLAEEYAPPGGAFLIARDAKRALGCAGVRSFAGSDGEIKRLYVIPEARGRGIGQLLARRAVAEGRKLGYKRLLLDTLPAMHAAQGLYAALGFRRTSAYRFNPLPGAAYFELPLD
jgi:ribosomal protein S18 acetylase RimI-like enzyme